MADLPAVASKLDAAVGLTMESAADGMATLRLEPGEVAVVDDEGLVYLHGGALATCIDTAAWFAAESAAPAGSEPWLVTSLSMEALRIAGDEPHRVIARCIRTGRSRAVVDVEVAPVADPERILTLGRVNLMRAPKR